ncbi:hypothetical protein V6N13_034237 [Hibiscus sabdariffa]
MRDEAAKAHPESCGPLLPTFSAKVVDNDTGCTRGIGGNAFEPSSVPDATVIPIEDEDSRKIPVVYVVKEYASQLTQKQVIQFVAAQLGGFYVWIINFQLIKASSLKLRAPGVVEEFSSKQANKNLDATPKTLLLKA